MQADLRAHIFYKVHFRIERSAFSMNTDILWKIVLLIRKWLSGKGYIFDRNSRTWTNIKNGGKLEGNLKASGTLHIESVFRKNPNNEEEQSWACLISEYSHDKGLVPRRWTTEIGFEYESEDSGRFTCVVSYEDVPGFLAKCKEAPSISVPNIVKMVINEDQFECGTEGGDPIGFRAEELCVGDGIMLRKLLEDSRRTIPVLLIMPVDTEEGVRTLIETNKIVESVAGNALVYYSKNTTFCEENKEILGQRYWCAPGMIRIYLPHVDLDDSIEAGRHRFFTKNDVIELGEEEVLNILRRVLAQDKAEYDRLFRYEDCWDLKRSDGYSANLERVKKEKIVLEKEIEKRGENDEIYEQIISLKEQEWEEEKKALINDRDSIKAELNEKKVEVSNCKAEIMQYRNSFENVDGKVDKNEYLRSIEHIPNDTETIVRIFEEIYGDRLAFTDRCMKSLKTSKIEVKELWDILFAFSTKLFNAMRNNENYNVACQVFEEQTTYTIAGNTGLTKGNKKLMRQFEDTYKGKPINIETHIKGIGRKKDDQRIYFCVDREDDIKIIIGSIGEHLDTSGKYRTG